MFSKTIKAIAIASVIAGTTAATAYAYPHTGYQAQIENQINSVIAGARGQGFNLIVANQRGQMYTGGGDSYFIVYLQAGPSYRFAARCDTDCTDLDMSLRDANGRELIADRDRDDFPTFTIRAPYTGAYRVISKWPAAAPIAARSARWCSVRRSDPPSGLHLLLLWCSPLTLARVAFPPGAARVFSETSFADRT